MIHFDDLTEKELAFRKLLTRKKSDFERRDSPFSMWAAACREAWAQTPEGKRALAEGDSKVQKIRRRVHGDESGGA